MNLISITSFYKSNLYFFFVSNVLETPQTVFIIDRICVLSFLFPPAKKKGVRNSLIHNKRPYFAGEQERVGTTCGLTTPSVLRPEESQSELALPASQGRIR